VKALDCRLKLAELVPMLVAAPPLVLILAAPVMLVDR